MIRTGAERSGVPRVIHLPKDNIKRESDLADPSLGLESLSPCLTTKARAFFSDAGTRLHVKDSNTVADFITRTLLERLMAINKVLFKEDCTGSIGCFCKSSLLLLRLLQE